MTKFKEKIIELIPSNHLRKIMRNDPDWLTSCGYFDAIFILSETLEIRKELLKELLEEWESFRTEDKYANVLNHKLYLEQHIEFCEIYLNAINNFDRSNSELFLVINDVYYFNYENHVPVLSRADAKRYVLENRDGYKDCARYELQLHEFKYDSLRRKYSYELNKNGDIKSARFETVRFSIEFEDSVIFGYGDGIYVPVPFEPGDVVYVKEKDTYCLVLNSRGRGFLNYISFNDKGEARFFDWHEGFWGLYPGSTRLHFDEIIFKGEKSDRVFTGDAAFVNELSRMIKENPEIGEMDCFEKINDEYPPQKLSEIIRSEMK